MVASVLVAGMENIGPDESGQYCGAVALPSPRMIITFEELACVVCCLSKAACAA